MSGAEYQLYYWPSIQGRGEFVRLAFEQAGADYVDVARLPTAKGGVAAMMKVLKRDDATAIPFAPPFLEVDGHFIAQVANILQFLGPRLGLVPDDAWLRLAAHQHQLTIADLVAEAHDAHHPIGSGLYYEDQKPEARRRAESFRAQRLPKFLPYFERVLAASGGRFMLGKELSYVDLSMFQLLSGLEYAFPRAIKQLQSDIPRLVELGARVAELPRVKAYLASPRRLPFNEDGIFRHYPELDG